MLSDTIKRKQSVQKFKWWQCCNRSLMWIVNIKWWTEWYKNTNSKRQKLDAKVLPAMITMLSYYKKTLRCVVKSLYLLYSALCESHSNGISFYFLFNFIINKHILIKFRLLFVPEGKSFIISIITLVSLLILN